MDEKEHAGFLERFAKWYEQSPVAKAIQLEPHIGTYADVGFSALSKIYEAKNEKLQNEFYNYLDAHIKKTLAPEEIMNDKFLRPLFQTMRVVENTLRQEKIELFARLFARYVNGWDMGDPYEYDKFDEYLKIVDDLSYREFQILLLMYKISREDKVEGMSDIIYKLKQEAEENLDISPVELSGHLTRLTRTGFYQISNGGLSVGRDTGSLTKNFDVFLEYLGMNTEQDS